MELGEIADRVARIREQMAKAAAQAGRDENEVLLLAATKMNDAQRVREAIAAGVDICGENRVQEHKTRYPVPCFSACSTVKRQVPKLPPSRFTKTLSPTSGASSHQAEKYQVSEVISRPIAVSGGVFMGSSAAVNFGCSGVSKFSSPSTPWTKTPSAGAVMV